jgi:hypothetical protein
MFGTQRCLFQFHPTEVKNKRSIWSNVYHQVSVLSHTAKIRVPTQPGLVPLTAWQNTDATASQKQFKA